MLEEVRGNGLQWRQCKWIFILLERTVEHKVNGIIIYVYNVDESALTTCQGGGGGETGQGQMEKWNIPHFGSFKWEEGKHYNSNSRLVSAAACCAPPTVNTKRQEHVKTYSLGHRQVFFIPPREQLQQRI
jgi:hypothetical protein